MLRSSDEILSEIRALEEKIAKGILEVLR